MKKYLLLLIFLLIFSPAISSAERINGLDVDWESSNTYTLDWTHSSASRSDYTIKVIDFDWNGHASISVTRRGETQYGVLSSGETTIFDFTRNSTTFQGLKIDAGDISNYDSTSDPPVNIGTYPCCPQAEITVSAAEETGQKPVLELESSIDWDGRSGYESSMNIQIKNTGDAQFSEGNMTINISGLEPNEQELSYSALTYNPLKGTITRNWYAPLLANNSYNITISLKPPIPPDPNKSTFVIKTDAYFKDSTGEVYYTTSTLTVSLNQVIDIDKKITPETIIGERDLDDETHKGIFSLGKITVVSIYVTNHQSYTIRSVNLTDTVIDGFRLVNNNTKLQWVFDINGSEKKEFRYEMIAQRTGSFTAPAATARWTEWGITKSASSSSPSTRVYGAFVTISKNANKLTFNLNESINISMHLENTGDLPVEINVTDILPENTSLISGNTTFNGYLRPTESVYIMYNVSAEGTGERELPRPQINFRKKDYSDSYSFVPGKNITVITASELKTPQVDNIIALPTSAPTEAPTEVSSQEVPIETTAPKSLLDIISERAPWLEGAVPIVMLLVTIILMLMLHVLNR